MGDFESWMQHNKDKHENNDDLKFAYPGNKISIKGKIGCRSDLVLLYKMKKIEGCSIWNDAMMFPGSRDKMRVKWTVRLGSKKTASDSRSVQFKKSKRAINPPTEEEDTA